MLTRRHVLASVGGLGAMATLSGCLFGIDSAGNSTEIHLEEVPREQLGQDDAHTPDELEPKAREIVSEGLTNGTTVYSDEPPLESWEFVVSNGSYYSVQVTENGTGTVERPVLEAEPVSSSNGSVVDWRNVSPSDARAIRCAISNSDGYDDRPCVISRDNDSAFWPEPRFQYVEGGDDEYYRLRTSEQRFPVDRYDYTFELVARNRSAFADYVARERVLVDFSTVDLSDEQRNILRTAANEGVYEEWEPYSEAFEDLVDRLEVARLDSPKYRPGSWYVRFDGTYYEVDVTRSLV